MRARKALVPRREAWRLRGCTLQAMTLLCVAQLAVQLVPFRYWRGTLGRLRPADGPARPVAVGSAGPARRIAAHVERGAARLPFATKCLPRAMVLCWLLRWAGVAYVFKIAARPTATSQANLPKRNDNLHAWVEAGNTTLIGALPGPWLEVLVLFG